MAPTRVVLGLLGTTLDVGYGDDRWERWRPSVCLFQQEDLAFDRFELLVPRQGIRLAKLITKDIATVSPGTTVTQHSFDPIDPWDFEEVYTKLHDFAAKYPFDPEREEYFLHITTGTHVAQICLFLLAETRRFPAKLVQTAPVSGHPAGHCRVIDLNLSKYDSIAARFEQEYQDNVTSLKSGIATRNSRFNRLIEELERVAANSVDPILITGPTGAGKSHLARRIYELKKHRHQLSGAFVEVNCATLRGDGAMSALFGHRKGSFTGATSDRPGLLRAANEGLLFLDELGELGLDEQAMLLRAVEEKRFLPVGADQEASSQFQLVAGTNRDLAQRVREGHFREDLLARINLWTFCLPPLRDRREDIEPNVDYELDRFAQRAGRTVRFSSEARDVFLAFALRPTTLWPGNFRDLSASVTRMATLSASGRITLQTVESEITRLESALAPAQTNDQDWCTRILSSGALHEIDPFDRVQLNEVIRVCARTSTLSEAGRELFAASRRKRTSINDADRLRKYLARFDLTFDDIKTSGYETSAPGRSG